MNKIVVVGFPHSGTTILRKLIGNSEDVYDYPYEVCTAPVWNIDTKNIVIKFTYSGPDQVKLLRDDFSTYDDYKVILIIKNPFDIFGSLIQRFGRYQLPIYHQIEDWCNYADVFLKYRNNPLDNVFTTKYEELFENNYEQIKRIYKFLDIPFYDEIITMKRDTHIVSSVATIPENEPHWNKGHAMYRTWQINGEFKDKTGESADCLSKDIKDRLNSLDVVKKLNYII